MKKLYYKVLEIKEQNSHTADDIDDIVKSRIEKLNEEYNTRYDRNKTQGKYISDEYKAFVTYTGKDADKYDILLDECIIRTTNIANFIDGKTKRPQNVTKDFFAIYCKCEGYNDFVVKYKNTEVIESVYTSLAENSKLKIVGATIVNEDFIAHIKTQDFSVLEFYTAIQSENSLCQWYGVVANDLDIERKDYGKLKEAVIASSNQKREYKICGIILGTGGSGKSTALRRLCVDIQKNENFTVVWVNDVMQFCQYGISAIKQDLEANSNKKYIVVIEDWYRMFHNNSETGSELLKQLHKYNNIRIVIGDRTIVGKPYENYGSDYNLLLSSNENKKIIQQIIKKYPDWQTASETLFNSPNAYQPTLFLLLFI